MSPKAKERMEYWGLLATFALIFYSVYRLLTIQAH